jgi:hypothetical protein
LLANLFQREEENVTFPLVVSFGVKVIDELGDICGNLALLRRTALAAIRAEGSPWCAGGGQSLTLSQLASPFRLTATGRALKLESLIVQMAGENSGWGYHRIVGR